MPCPVIEILHNLSMHVACSHVLILLVKPTKLTPSYFSQDSDLNVNSHLSYCSYFNNGVHTCYVMSMPGAPPPSPLVYRCSLLAPTDNNKRTTPIRPVWQAAERAVRGTVDFPDGIIAI